MTVQGANTRERILDAAETLVLEHGFAGTGIQAILGRAELTKGGFFYHFSSKAELARALLQRYANRDLAQLDAMLERVERLTDDPVRRALLFVGLYEDALETTEDPDPGCLFASYCYEAGLLDDETLEIVRRSLLEWRERLGDLLRRAFDARPPRAEVDPDDLADAFTAIVEGGLVLGRALQDRSVVARQLRQYRTYLELLFREERGGGAGTLEGG